MAQTDSDAAVRNYASLQQCLSAPVDCSIFLELLDCQRGRFIAKDEGRLGDDRQGEHFGGNCGNHAERQTGIDTECLGGIVLVERFPVRRRERDNTSSRFGNRLNRILFEFLAEDFSAKRKVGERQDKRGQPGQKSTISEICGKYCGHGGDRMSVMVRHSNLRIKFSLYFTP